MPFLTPPDAECHAYSCGPDEIGAGLAAKIIGTWCINKPGTHWVVASLRGNRLSVAIEGTPRREPPHLYVGSEPIVVAGDEMMWTPQFSWNRHTNAEPLPAEKIPADLRKAVVNWLKYGTPEPEREE